MYATEPKLNRPITQMKMEVRKVAESRPPMSSIMPTMEPISRAVFSPLLWLCMGILLNN